MKNITFAIILCLVFALGVNAQTSNKTSQVIEMIRLKMTDHRFTATELIEIKKAGGSNELLERLSGATTSETRSAVSEPTSTSTPNSRFQVDGKSITATRFQGQETAKGIKGKLKYGLGAMSGLGQIADQTGIIGGRSAETRTANRSPHFIVGQDFSADNYALVQLEQKKDSRQVTIGKMKFFRISNGPEKDKMVKFYTNKIRSGFEITIDGQLEPGEYAFIQVSELRQSNPFTGSGASNPQIFAFGID